MREQLCDESQSQTSLNLHIRLLNTEHASLTSGSHFDASMRDLFMSVIGCHQLESFGAAIGVQDRLHSNKWTKLMAMEAVKDKQLHTYSFADMTDYRLAAQLCNDILERFPYVGAVAFGRCPAYHSVWRHLETMKLSSRRQIDTFSVRPTAWSMKQHQQLLLLLLQKLPHISRVVCDNAAGGDVDTDFSILSTAIAAFTGRVATIPLTVSIRQRWLYTRPLRRYADVWAPNARLRRKVQRFCDTCHQVLPDAHVSVVRYQLDARTQSRLECIVQVLCADGRRLTLIFTLDNFVLVDDDEVQRSTSETTTNGTLRDSVDREDTPMINEKSE